MKMGLRGRIVKDCAEKLAPRAEKYTENSPVFTVICKMPFDNGAQLHIM